MRRVGSKLKVVSATRPKRGSPRSPDEIYFGSLQALSPRFFELPTQQRPQFGKRVLNDGPEYLRVDRVVAVDDDIAKRDDPCGFGELPEDRPFEVANAGKSLAEDLELPLDGVLPRSGWVA